MDPRTNERRRDPRLALNYPIRARVEEPGEGGRTGAVTSDLAAGGAFFKTFSWAHFREGQRVAVRIRVPHPLAGREADLLHLDMHTTGRVCRLAPVTGREARGEDGRTLMGVAVEFESPLEFSYLSGHVFLDEA